MSRMLCSLTPRLLGFGWAISSCGPGACQPVRLAPELDELDHRRGRDRQILHRHPLADGVVLHAAVVDVRRRQALLGQARAVGAAADRVRARLESDAAGGLEW